MDSPREESEVEENTDEEVDVEEAYELLYQDCRKLHKQNEKLTVKNKVLKRERDNLKIALEELQGKIDSLEASKKRQEDLITNFKTKLDQKDNELKDAQAKLQTLQFKTNTASSKLDEILGMQRNPNDKRGLGYTGEKKIMEEASTSNQNKMKVIKIHSSKQATTQKVNSNSPSSKQLKGNQSTQNLFKVPGTPCNFQRKFIPICHHCGIPGHIRPHCHKLYGLPLTYVDTRNSLKPTFRVSNRFDPLRFQDSRPYMTRPMRKNKNKNFSKPLGPKPNKPKTQNVVSKIRSVWVRKSDLYVTNTPKNIEP